MKPPTRRTLPAARLSEHGIEPLTRKPRHAPATDGDADTPALDPATVRGLHALCETLLGEVRADRPDLTLRQMTVLLTVYLTDEPQTVRGLAAYLNVSKPVITRVFDRLCELDLMLRRADPKDLRSVIAERTPCGIATVMRLEAAMATAAAGPKR